MDALAIKLLPHISEQTYTHAEDKNVYVFIVPIIATRQQIKAAVEKQFKVSVTGVNIAISKGKAKQSYRKRQQPLDGRRKNVKKAYVTVKSGDKIPVYEELS